MKYPKSKHIILSEIYANLSLHKLEDVVDIRVKLDDIVLHTFKYGTGLSYFYVPRGVTVLAPSCFSGVELKVIMISPTVTTIGYACFANCSELRVIRVPYKLSCYEKDIRYGNNAKIVYF